MFLLSSAEPSGGIGGLVGAIALGIAGFGWAVVKVVDYLRDRNKEEALPPDIAKIVQAAVDHHTSEEEGRLLAIFKEERNLLADAVVGSLRSHYSDLARQYVRHFSEVKGTLIDDSDGLGRKVERLYALSLGDGASIGTARMIADIHRAIETLEDVSKKITEMHRAQEVAREVERKRGPT